MSAELRARFTADATDFNAQVRGIENKLRGLGGMTKDLGQGVLGRGLRDISGIVGGLGMGAATAGIGTILAAVTAAAGSMRDALDERAKAIQAGMPVQDLTAFGDVIEQNIGFFRYVGNAVSKVGVLLTQGVDAWVNSINKSGIWSEQVAEHMRTKAMILASDISRDKAAAAQSEAAQKAIDSGRVKQALEIAREAQRTVEEGAAKSAQVTAILEATRLQNRLIQMEQRGEGVKADAIRIADQVNAVLGATIYSADDVMQMIGADLEQARALSGRPSLPPQFAPELTDRLTAMGGLSGRASDNTPREMLSAERQAAETLRRIEQKMDTNGGTLLR